MNADHERHAVVDAKAAVRRAVRERVQTLDAAARDANNHAINAHLSDALHRAGLDAPGTVLGYCPMAGEVDIGATLRAALKAGWRVCLPRVDREESTMTPVQIDAWPIIEGRSEPVFGSLRQPDGRHIPVHAPDIDVVLVPGVAFDAFGGRVGRGGGYYDRFLVRVTPGCRCWGIAWSARVVEGRVPTEPHDRAMDAIVTEAGMRSVS